MIDQRRLYINQILNHYKIPNKEDNVIFSVDFTYDGKNHHHKFFYHNDGLEYVKEYIKYLQDKIYKYEYLERIIQAARKEDIK